MIISIVSVEMSQRRRRRIQVPLVLLWIKTRPKAAEYSGWYEGLAPQTEAPKPRFNPVNQSKDFPGTWVNPDCPKSRLGLGLG